MEQIFARLSKSGRVLCGWQSLNGSHTCDEPLAELVTVGDAPGRPDRRPAHLDGWVQDRKGVWQRTTRLEDKRRHGAAVKQRPAHERIFADLPALLRCPKCRSVQWLEPERLRPEAGTSRHPGLTPGNRWVARR